MNTFEAPSAPVGFRPLADRILVRPDKVGEFATAGGRIVLPQATRAALQKRVNVGTVLSVGPGMLMGNGERWPMPCKPGDRLLFIADGPVHVTVDGEELLSMRDDFALAVLEEES
jgi:co-chaperonin GroES (HSP10)